MSEPPTRTLPPGIEKVPGHIAVIMDGNGRWAAERGLPRVKGHEAGAESVRACVKACGELGVRVLTLYAFSTENWRRPRQETDALMGLLEKFLRERTPEMVERGIQLAAIGRLNDLPPACRRQLDRSIEATAGNTGITLVFALSYSGRAELVDAIRSIAAEVRAGALDPDQIDEEVVRSHLQTRRWPDPDLLIRTSGEMRVSNFLLWQISYTELHVTKKYWPDFREEDLIEAVRDFNRRHRRYGGI